MDNDLPTPCGLPLRHYAICRVTSGNPGSLLLDANRLSIRMEGLGTPYTGMAKGPERSRSACPVFLPSRPRKPFSPVSGRFDGRSPVLSRPVSPALLLKNTAPMKIALVSGSAGLIGSEAVRHFASSGMTVVGIDNDMRSRFFGEEASTRWQQEQLEQELGDRYQHVNGDIRDEVLIGNIFAEYSSDIELVIHAAAQPSHDWAAREPITDFTVNANGTLNLLESTRKHAPRAVFIFTSTNKVYGDTPNRLPLVELATRWEIAPDHVYRNGIAEDMSIDQSMHSLFGASKVAADVIVQEYGRYFGMNTGCFRGGCLTGPNHSGTQLHGFLAYLVKCTVTGMPYTVFGYKGKQVRDNIHSHDLIQAFEHFYRTPRQGEVYNIGGSRFSNCSMLEAIEIAGKVAGRELRYSYKDANRAGDHIWYVSDVSKFERHYPGWRLTRNIHDIITEIHDANVERWQAEPVTHHA
jgi:CDP-paratose 2-epimerase